MDTRQIQLVWETFERLRPLPPGWAREFYDRLFLIDPSLRPLFKRDLESQSRMFEGALSLAVMGMREDSRVIRKLVAALGAEHAGYGIPPSGIGSFGEALLWTLERKLGEAFTPEVKEAWAAAYEVLASGMLRGGAQASRE